MRGCVDGGAEDGFGTQVGAASALVPVEVSAGLA